MGAGGRLTAAGAAIGLALSWSGGAMASGPSATAPWYVDQYGGGPADLAAFYNGRVGIVMPTAPRPMLLISWRLLHGLKVGPSAGEALSSPCCGTPWWAYDWSAGRNAWTMARKLVPGAPEVTYVDTEREGPDHQFTPNCYEEAFDTATATLKDRAAQHGGGSPEVRAWLATQDAVFENCHATTPLPAPLPGAPAWLAADRAYQEAAAALYDGRYVEAAERFAAIGRDAASPWRDKSLYLSARALTREALAKATPESYAQARAAVARLAAAPADTFGRSQAQALINLLDFHERPETFAALLEKRLNAAEPGPDIAADFRDLSDLADLGKTDAEALDWMRTLKARPAPPDAHDPALADGETTAQETARFEHARIAARDHATGRWGAAHDPAWLIGALSLTAPGEPHVERLIRDAEAVPVTSPAWLSIQYHVIRLTLAASPAPTTRARLDAILARADLSLSDRNVFEAHRAQVAADPADFARHALRQRICSGLNETWTDPPRRAPACARERWDNAEVQPDSIYDGVGSKGSTGLGEDARAILDRAPLATRIALSRDATLPKTLRLDLALTSYARAVQLQDGAAIDALAGRLADLLPLMAKEFRDVRTARAGPDKRFAEFLVLAKIPGVRVDLVDYVRPEGRRIADFQGYWTDWVIARRPTTATPPPLARYQYAGALPQTWSRPPWPDALTDLTCLGECGRAASSPRAPDFIEAGRVRAAAERAFFVSMAHDYGQPPPAMPPGSIDAWEEMLAYAKAHPADPRIPEALHWLVHVGHFGGSHDHSGRRAFRLLHARYEGSYWAKKTPYYND